MCVDDPGCLEDVTADLGQDNAAPGGLQRDVHRLTQQGPGPGQDHQRNRHGCDNVGTDPPGRGDHHGSDDDNDGAEEFPRTFR